MIYLLKTGSSFVNILCSQMYTNSKCVSEDKVQKHGRNLFNLLVWDTFLFKWVNVFVTDTKYVLTSLTIYTVYHSYSNPFGREIIFWAIPLVIQSNGVFPKRNRNSMGLISRSHLSHVSVWHYVSILVSNTRGGRFEPFTAMTNIFVTEYN